MKQQIVGSVPLVGISAISVRDTPDNLKPSFFSANVREINGRTIGTIVCPNGRIIEIDVTENR